MLKSYTLIVGVIALLALTLFLLKPPEILVGKAATISNVVSSTQKVMKLDFNEGIPTGTTTNTNGDISGTSGASWISPVINSRPESTSSKYVFWDKIVVDQLASGTLISTRTSPDGVSWNAWSEPIILDINTVKSPQDQYIQVRLDFTATNTIRSLDIYYTPAFEFNMNPLDNTNSEITNNLPVANRRVVTSGNKFLFDNNDGTFDEAKFYGIQLYTLTNLVDHETANEICTYLKNRGYNLLKTQITTNTGSLLIQDYTIVEMFQDGINRNSGSALNFNTEQLDKLDYLINRCKQEGVYTYLRILAPRPHTEDVFEDKEIRPSLQYSEYFMPEQSAFHKAFYTKLLNHNNPYSGMAYKEDPAIAFYELTNENHLFHGYKTPGSTVGSVVLHADGFVPLEWTQYAPFSSITPNQNDSLNTLWNDWLKNKYANRDALVAVWGDDVIGSFVENDITYPKYGLRADEDPWSNTVERQDWRYLPTGGGRRQYLGINYARYTDISLFYQDLEISFYDDHINEIKNVLGAQGLITNTNLYRGSYSLESQATADFIDNHAYWESFVGDSITPLSSMLYSLTDEENNIMTYLVKTNMKNKPMTVSEYNSMVMSMYDSEILPFVDAYSAFHEFDAIVQFHFGDKDITNPANRIMWQHSVPFDPVKATQVPISSKAYLEWISPANTVIEYYFNDETAAFLDANGNFNSLGLRDNWNDNSYLKNNYLLKHGFQISDIHSPTIPEYSQFQSLYGIEDNPPTKIMSDTNELYMDTDMGIFYPLHPKYQGAVGNTGGMTHDIMPDVEISIQKSAFNSTSILLGSLDGNDLVDSNKILVTAGSRSENYGTIWNNDHSTWIKKTGANAYYYSPVLTTGIDATIKLNTNKQNLAVYKLTPNGQLSSLIPSTLTNGILQFQITNSDETIWYIIKESTINFLKWDLDQSGVVDSSDLTQLLEQYRKTDLEIDFNLAYDLVPDGIINILDLTEIAIHYGESI